MKFTYCIVIFILTWRLSAQQDPQYTQYMYNFNIVNPAYVGAVNGLSVGALYRMQWTQFSGAPHTATVNIGYTPTHNLGVGLSVINDQIGPVNETNAYTDFSYTLYLKNKHRVGLGIKAGATFHKIGISDTQITIIDAGDPFFAENITSTSPNVGFGVYMYKPNKYYISGSMPNIINAVHLDKNGSKIGSEVQHIFAAAGYVFSISDNLKIKPHTLFKLAYKAPLSFDTNLNAFMYDMLEVGIGYRYDDSFNSMVNFLITPSLRIGYAYDRVISKLTAATQSSHELILNYHISFSKRVSRSPRYF